jgi:hypothetical protein
MDSLLCKKYIEPKNLMEKFKLIKESVGLKKSDDEFPEGS